jgi:hypothetical protein
VWLPVDPADVVKGETGKQPEQIDLPIRTEKQVSRIKRLNVKRRFDESLSTQPFLGVPSERYKGLGTSECTP